MLRLIFFTTFCVFFTASVQPGPAYPPTRGEVWPKPQHQVKSDSYFRYSSVFQFTNIGISCDILTNAMSRYSQVLNNMNSLRSRQKRSQRRMVMRMFEEDPYYQGVIQELKIDLSSPCDEYPYLDMDEQYNLTVSSNSQLSSQSIWGVLRGLETFVQLIYISEGYTDLLINETSIIDYPRYPHRGLLIDTSRHYIHVGNILKTLDAMAMNKMNVLHWHIVDDQSFPYVSEKFPELSLKGAYHPTMVYTRLQITRIINYARDRGIRVLPEFDVPGHTRSWGEAYPTLLTKCYTQDADYGPLNPIQNATYKFMKDLFKEVQGIFPDTYLHVGGDEVDFQCWSSNPEINKFMQEHGMNLKQLFAYFMANIVPLLGTRSKPIVWQEVFDEGVPLPDNTIVQTWKTENGAEMTKVIKKGYKTIYSASWYLDQLESGGDWIKFYDADPRSMIKSKKLDLNNILGGEACMWGEVVDDNNFLSRIWPRASAVAEKLWSPFVSKKYRKLNVLIVRMRLEEHTCRMIRRGIPAQPPNGAGFCFWRKSRVLDRGFKVVSSEFFYLDHLNSGGDWMKYYTSDPRTIVASHPNITNILGGEACMWTEVVDDNNIFSRVWPRASAVAEVLWSARPAPNYDRYGYYGYRLDTTVNNRLEEHTCRMNRRGIPAQPPTGPGFCYTVST